MQIEVIIEKKSHKLDAEEGKTILETLQEHGIHVLTAPCGGRGRCGKCTVEVEHMGEVLACMTKVTDGMRITIPEVQLRAQKSKIAENGTVTHYPADDGEGLDAACDIGTRRRWVWPSDRWKEQEKSWQRSVNQAHREVLVQMCFHVFRQPKQENWKY